MGVEWERDLDETDQEERSSSEREANFEKFFIIYKPLVGPCQSNFMLVIPRFTLRRFRLHQIMEGLK